MMETQLETQRRETQRERREEEARIWRRRRRRRRPRHAKSMVTSAFGGYEAAVADGLIDGFGVDSNGLGPPHSNNMHLDFLSNLANFDCGGCGTNRITF